MLAATKDMLRSSQPWCSQGMESLVQEDDSMSPCFRDLDAWQR